MRKVSFGPFLNMKDISIIYHSDVISDSDSEDCEPPCTSFIKA